MAAFVQMKARLDEFFIALNDGPVRASDPIASALLVAGVAEVHQFPDRVVLVGLDQLTRIGQLGA